MEQCAIILNGNDVVKVSNLKRKYKKLTNNPDIKILEECSLEQLEDRYNYWKSIINESVDYTIKVDKPNKDSNIYYFKNNKTGYTIVSIYPDLESCKLYILDWEDYERYS